MLACTSWPRRSSLRGVTAVHGRPERGLSFTSLSPLIKLPTHRLTVLNIHCLVSVNVQHASRNVIGYNFFPHGGIQLHAFASYALPCQTPFCQTSPLLSSVARTQNLTEYWREGSTSTAILPTPASGVVGQRNKIGRIYFGAALVVTPRGGSPIFIISVEV